MQESLLPALVILGVLLVIFLVCRELVCWYWKINRTVELLEQIHQELKLLNTKKDLS